MPPTPPDPLALLRELIRRPSLTPDDAGCSALLLSLLEPFGFRGEWMHAEDVTNLWARRGGTGPLLVFAGHTDVVPPGPRQQWSSDPFEPVERDGLLYGRGAADMKSGLAAMVAALCRFVQAHPDHRGSLALLLTSDEEGPCRHGTRHVAEVLRRRGEIPDFAVIGEAASLDRLGDRIMIGRRGSLGCDMRVIGVQGHVAYPERADNPIHRACALVAELAARRWDEGNEHFPPTSFQVSDFHAGTGAHNVIPGHAELSFNFRYGTASSADGLKAAVADALERHGCVAEQRWWHTGEPFLTAPDAPLVRAAIGAVEQVTGRRPQPSTAGGTSDGRFLAPLGTQVVEIGPVGRSIHRVDEHVAVADLEPLTCVYLRLAQTLLTDRPD